MTQRKRKKKRVLGLDDPAFKKRFEREQEKWAKIVRPLIDAARRSEQITEKDLRIVINARA